MSEIVTEAEARASQWQQVLAEYHASGKGLMVFCREQGISHHSLRYWRKKFFAADSIKPRGVKFPRRFVAVSGSFKFNSSAPRIVLPNGVHIDLGAGFESSLVTGLILNLCGVACPAKDGHHAES